MENPFEELKARCKAAGITLGHACKAAGIQRSTIWYWKNNPPSQIETYRKMMATIDKLAADADTPTVSA